jgi:hypothetical protein
VHPPFFPSVFLLVPFVSSAPSYRGLWLACILSRVTAPNAYHAHGANLVMKRRGSRASDRTPVFLIPALAPSRDASVPIGESACARCPRRCRSALFPTVSSRTAY